MQLKYPLLLTLAGKSMNCFPALVSISLISLTINTSSIIIVAKALTVGILSTIFIFDTFIFVSSPSLYK